MFSLFNKCSVFISHKRCEGKVSFDASWFEEKLRDRGIYNTFMDVREDYIGNFPKVLSDKIKKSDVFLLVLPSDRDLNYLLDPDNWVHKEIQYALRKKEYDEQSIKIIPVSFKDNVVFPSKKVLGNIADIADYCIIYCDLNDQENSKKRLYNAIGYKPWQCYLTWRSIVVALFILYSLFFIAGNIVNNKPYEEVPLHYVETINTLKSLPVSSTDNKNIELANKLQAKILQCFNLVIQMQPDANPKGTEENRIDYYTQILQKTMVINTEYGKVTELYKQLAENESTIEKYCVDLYSLNEIKNKQSIFNGLLKKGLEELQINQTEKEKIVENIALSDELWEYLDAYRVAYSKVFNGINSWKVSQESD